MDASTDLLSAGHGSVVAGVVVGLSASSLTIWITDFASTVFTGTLVMIGVAGVAALAIPAQNRMFIGIVLGALPVCLLAGLAEVFIGGLGS